MAGSLDTTAICPIHHSSRLICGCAVTSVAAAGAIKVSADTVISPGDGTDIVPGPDTLTGVVKATAAASVKSAIVNKKIR